MKRVGRLLGGTTLFVVIGFLFYQCTEVALPPIARGLTTYSGPEGEFSARLKQKYKPGISDVALIQDLRAQGFKVKGLNELYGGGMRMSVADIDRLFACGTKTYSVRWHSEKGRMTEIFGVYGVTCL